MFQRLDWRGALLGAGCCFSMGIASAAEELTLTLNPESDATLYETSSGRNHPANGAGEALFAGRTNVQLGGVIRRFLVRFDLDQLPANAEIQSATLTFVYFLNINRDETDPTTLHRVTSDWNEGPALPFNNGGGGTAATPSDVTWVRRGIGDFTWDTQGGDYINTPSATGDGPALIGESLVLQSPGMVEDLNFWRDTPEQNFGWIIRGDESGPIFNARGYGSRENDDPALLPKLEIRYTLTQADTPSDAWMVY
ncbi:MAG: DNRLRE domain-containing protein [Candidatus Sumerlaeia bacterium]|nr:DNRLRE domain-containing protein [Candidatus Sumerlaeia bacterium]